MNRYIATFVFLSAMHSVSYAQAASYPNPNRPETQEHITISDQLNTVLAEEKAGHIQEAMGLAQALYKQNTDAGKVRLILGRLLVKLGDAKAAQTILQPLATRHTSDWRAWFWLGSAQLMLGHFKQAGYSLDEALSREGNVVAIWVQRAIVEQETGNLDAALNMLQVADVIEPENADVLLNFAYSSERAGKLKQAIMAYKRFLQASSAQSKYNNVRSQVLYRLSRISIVNPVDPGNKHDDTSTASVKESGNQQDNE